MKGHVSKDHIHLFRIDTAASDDRAREEAVFWGRHLGVARAVTESQPQTSLIRVIVGLGQGRGLEANRAGAHGRAPGDQSGAVEREVAAAPPESYADRTASEVRSGSLV